jgi:hypothetical protein
MSVFLRQTAEFAERRREKGMVNREICRSYSLAQRTNTELPEKTQEATKKKRSFGEGVGLPSFFLRTAGFGH